MWKNETERVELCSLESIEIDVRIRKRNIYFILADPQAVSAALLQIEELETEERQQILNVPAAKNRVTEYFEQDISAKVVAVDFPGVQNSLART
jgi:hypothetical protein